MNARSIHSYSEKLALLQWECDEIVSFRTQQARDYKAARKHYESNHSTRYYFQLPGCKYDAIKSLFNDQGEVIHSYTEILQQCHKFYSKLYTKTPHREADDENLQWHFLKNIPAVMKIEHIEILGKDLCSEELLAALNVMKKRFGTRP